MSLHVPWKRFCKCDLLRFCGEDYVAIELETVLGIPTNNKLNFENHIKSLCNKATQKLGALQRISNMLDTQKKNLLFNSIIRYLSLLTMVKLKLIKLKFEKQI